MSRNLYRKIRKYTPSIAVIILFVLLIVATKYFVHSLKSFYNEGELRPHYHSFHKPLPPDAHNRAYAVVSPWMTFDYINVVYGLPPDYLKGILGVTDQAYPNIRLDRYAKKKGISTADIISEIEQAITTFPNQK